MLRNSRTLAQGSILEHPSLDQTLDLSPLKWVDSLVPTSDDGDFWAVGEDEDRAAVFARVRTGGVGDMKVAGMFEPGPRFGWPRSGGGAALLAPGVLAWASSDHHLNHRLQVLAEEGAATLREVEATGVAADGGDVLYLSGGRLHRVPKAEVVEKLGLEY